MRITPARYEDYLKEQQPGYQEEKAAAIQRERELIGEGHRYFDLIRTRRLMSAEWTMSPLTLDQYNRGGWTWPIDPSAMNNNPNMKLNEYWTTIGR